MKLRNSICWLVYHVELGALGGVLLDVAFGRLPRAPHSLKQPS
jgi:hypothetical protein